MLTNKSCQPRHPIVENLLEQVLCNKACQSVDCKVLSSSRLCMFFPDEAMTDHASNIGFGPCGGKVTDSEPTRKNKTSAGTKDESIKRMRDPSGKMDSEKKFKKSKLDSLSLSKQQVNDFVDDFQGHIKVEGVCKDDKLPCSSGTGTITPEMMRIVKEVKKKPYNMTANKSSGDKVTRGDGSSGLRVKKIMHRAGEKSEVTNLVHKLTKQIRDVVSANPSKEFARDNPLDNKLLAAFRVAVVRPQMEVANKVNSSNLRFDKPILQRGKVRENLTKKIYRTNGRLRRAWGRDCEIEFWKHHCLTNKTKKVAALQSVLDILKGGTSPRNSSAKQESRENVENSILSRVYLADASVFPRTEDVKPLSDLAGSSATSVNVQFKGHRLNNSCGKDSHVAHGTKNYQEITSTSEQVTQTVHAKEEINSLSRWDKKECLKELKSGGLTSGPALSGSKESLLAAKDNKRKWALEVLARKNATTDRCKDREKQDQALLKGGFPLLVQLPMDMRPVVAPSRQSKVPLAVRQAQLNRLTELYLRKANGPFVHKTAVTELAVADAINIEKEIFERSKSKLVYINLCSQHAINFQNQTDETVDANKSTLPHEDVQPLNEDAGNVSLDTHEITEVDPLATTTEFMEVLKLTGLLSDSPPISPSRPNCAKDSAEVNMGNKDFENVLDMDCNTEVDIYRDFEYDLEDEAYSISKNLYTVSSNIQSDASKLKMKVVLSTMDFDKPSEAPEVSNCEDQQTSQLAKMDSPFDCIFSAEASMPVCEKEGSALSPSSKMDAAGSSSVLDLRDGEKHKESSWLDCEELYGPETKCSEENFHEAAAGKDVIPCDSGNDKLKNDPSISDFGRARDSGSKMAGGEVLSYPLHTKVISKKDEKLTSINQESSSDSVSQKVEAYIKEHIRPLCKSGIITAKQYRWAVVKTRDKVMNYHSKAKNASFLIKEGDKVKKLAQQYVEAASKQQDIKK